MSLDTAGPAWIFCPADRPERFAKAAAAGDVVILDLEDGAGDKPAARESVVNSALDPARTVVRINPHGTEDQRLDLEALGRTDYTTVMLPKCEAAEQVAALAPLAVVFIVETPLGALRVTECAAVPNTLGVFWGAEDLFGLLGGTANRFADGSYRQVAEHVRAQSLLAAKAFGKLALDSVYIDIKVALHPTQVTVIRDGYRPSAEQLQWARRVLDAAASQRGAFGFEGIMVDAPVLRRAERILTLAP